MFSTKLLCVALAATASVGEARLRRSASRGAVLAAEVSSLGRPGCPCIGIEGLKGEAFVRLPGNATYPAEVGSRCAAWDDGREPEHCADESQSPGKGSGWCAQQWCYVDPCQCDGKVLEAPPAPSQMFQAVASKAMPLYFSYSTCGGQDLWTETENKSPCAAAKTKEACESSDCSWKQTEQWGEVCLGLEAAGLCASATTAPEWGKPECPCVGFAGMNGTVEVAVGNNHRIAFPADVGATCEAWDMNRNPDCTGSTKAEGCDQKWCYVDPKHCKGAVKSAASTYQSSAKVQGSLLHYSYDTCGSVTPKQPPQGTAADATQPAAPSKEEDEEEPEEEYPAHHDLPTLVHDNPMEKANAAKALAKRVPRGKTPNEIAREEFAKTHGL